MKLQELNEAVKTIMDEDDFLAAVNQKCKPYLSQISGDTHMFRGVKKGYGSFIEEEPRKNRKPSDIPTVVHKELDEWFFNRFGVRFRSQALFASGNPHFVKSFGKVYEIFPEGEFKFIWSPIIKDLYKSLGSFFNSNHILLGDFHSHLRDFSDKHKQMLNEFLESAEYQTTNLSQALQSGNEIMVSCEQYLGVSEQTIEATDLYDDIRDIKERY